MGSSPIRVLTASLALLLMVLLSTVLHLYAQEKVSKIRRIYVPADAPESWPAGDWTPIPAAQLTRAERKPAGESQPDSWIKHARYSATFRDGTLQGGQFGIEIESPAHSSSERTSLLSWQDSNVAFSNLRWEDQPAQLGTSLDNKTLLLVPRGRRQLSGQWSLRGRPLAYGFQFRLQLPSAAVTELTLTLPQSAVFKTFDQTQWEYLDSPAAESRRVRLNPGSRTSVDFAVLQFDDSGPTVTAPTIFAHSETLVVLSRDQSRIRQELLIEALESPLSAVMFTLPAGVEIREVELGGRPLQDWVITGNRGQFLKVNFPEALTGLSRPLRLTGLLNHPPEELWRLPRIVPRNSVQLSERVTINVTPPLELLTVNERGYRQTAASTGPDGSGSLIFETIAPEGSIDIRIGLPPVRLRTELATRISAVNHRRTAFCELTGQVSSGRLYVFTTELAAGWNPTSIAVKLDAESEWFAGSHWWIAVQENRRLLHVELPRAISRDQSLELRMNFQQFPSATDPAVIPVVRTQSEVPCDQLIVLKRELMTPDRRSAVLTGWSEIAPGDGPEWLQRTQIGESLELDGGQWSLFSASSPAFLQLPETSSTPHFSARSEDRLVLEQDEAGILTLSESLSFDFEDISRPLSILTFSTSSETSLDLWNWNVIDRPEIEVQCLRQTNLAGAATGPQHWELVFVPPLTKSATVTAQQNSPLRKTQSAVLPVVQNSHQHSGRVVVENLVSDPLRSSLPLTSTLLQQPVPRALSSAQQFEAAYTQAGASLRFQPREDQVTGRRIETQVRWKTVFPSSDSNLLLHNLQLELPAGIARLTGSWPASIDPPAAWINGVPVTLLPDESEKFEIHWDALTDPTTLELEFSSPVEWSRSLYHCSIPLPQFDLNVLHGTWSVLFPEDSRISDYSESLSLYQSRMSSPVHWTRRFFGPLGRRTKPEFFQPLNVAEWRSLLESKVVDIELSRGDQPPAEEDSAAACHFRLSSWPREVNLKGWSETRQERYAWACFLVTLTGGVLIRIVQWETSRKLAAWSLPLLSLIAWTVPDSISIFTGAIFAAAVTAVLIPNLLLLGRRGASQEAEMQFIEGSTHTGIAVRMLFFGLILCAAGRIAAQSTKRTELRNANNSRVSTVDVLIPFSGSKPPGQLPDFVYIRESDRQLEIFQEGASKRPVLFTSADYHCRLAENETPTIRVQLQAELPVHREIPLLTIPLAGANLAREGACFVDGHAVPVSMTPEGLLEISLPTKSPEVLEATDPLRAPRPQSDDIASGPESRTIHIELNLYPPVSVQGTVKLWELQIPSISNSRFRCEFPRAGWPAPRLGGSRGEVHRIRDGLIAADLGKSTRISCQWSSTRFPESDDRELAKIDVQTIASIELLPTHLRYRIQTINKLKTGRLDYLPWQIPVNFHLHRVISDDVVLQTREVLTPTGKRIAFDLTETLTPQSAPQIIEAEFIVPFRTGQDEEISVVFPDLLATKTGSFSDCEYSSGKTIVGLWSPPELPLSVLEMSAAEIQSLTVEQFLSFWPEDASLPVPERVYELDTPATLTFLRTSTQPQKEAAWVHETGTIDDRYLEWEWNAEAKTTRLPAFQHEFQIDPRLEILSVSVREDQAERVHRWSREGSRLTVRLTRKTTEENSQEVTIRGRIPLSAEQQLELPEILLLAADRGESRVDLYLAPHRTARWLSGEVPSSPAASATTAANRGDLTLFDHVTRRENDTQPRTLVIGRKTPPPHFERVTTLRRRSDGDFDVSVLLTEKSSLMRDDSLQVMIPEEWVARLRPLPSMGEVVLDLEPLSEGGALITIPPEGRALPLILQTTLSAPQETTWTIPWPTLQGDSTYHNQVSLRLADGWAPHIDCRIDPADDSHSSSHSSEADRWEYLCDTLELQRTELSDPEAVPTILQLLATVDLQPDKPPYGQWWILYRGRGQKSLTLKSPIALQNVTAEINTQTVEHEYDADSRFLTIPLLPGEAWQSCLVNWTSETPLPNTVISEFQLQMPKVIDLEVRDSQVILVTHPDLKLALYHELKPESAWEFRVNILEIFRDILESGELRAADLPEGVSLLLAGLLSPARDSSASNSLQTENSSQKNRLEDLQKELRELLPADRLELPAGDLLSPDALHALSSWETLLPGLLAHSERPDRETIYFSISKKPEEGKVWWMSRQWYRVGIALAISLVLIPLSLRILQGRSANWAARQRPVVCLSIGLIWWTCLQLSALGLFIAVVAVVALFWTSVNPRRSRA